jgi:hypothetical protein
VKAVCCIAHKLSRATAIFVSLYLRDESV